MLITDLTEATASLSQYDSKNPMHASWARIFTRQKYEARRGSWTWNITNEYAWKVINDQNWRCALSGVPFTVGGSRSRTQPSLDRIDSSKGYEPGNIQYVTLVVNLAKKNMTDADFITMCKQVAGHSK